MKYVTATMLTFDAEIGRLLPGSTYCVDDGKAERWIRVGIATGGVGPAVPAAAQLPLTRARPFPPTRSAFESGVRAPRHIHHCRSCRAVIPSPGHGPALCTPCLERQMQPLGDLEGDSLPQNASGDMPGSATTYWNRRGESVTFGRIRPHRGAE